MLKPCKLRWSLPYARMVSVTNTLVSYFLKSLSLGQRGVFAVVFIIFISYTICQINWSNMRFGFRSLKTETGGIFDMPAKIR
jgi:hypothetical protein